MKFGDILRYPDDQGVGDEYLFAYLGTLNHRGQDYLNVMVLRAPKDDDQWSPGYTLVAGINELIPYIEPGTKVFFDGKELDVKSIDFGGMDFASGSDRTVLTIRDAHGSASGTITLSTETLLAALRDV